MKSIACSLTCIIFNVVLFEKSLYPGCCFPLPPIFFPLYFKNMIVYAFSIFLYNLCSIQNLEELNAEGRSYFLKPILVILHVSAKNNLKVYSLPEL